MSNEYASPTPKIKIGAGTAFKFGFFAALGVITLYLIIGLIAGVIGGILFALGGLPDWASLLNP
jgi:uncharacterized membrane protein